MNQMQENSPTKILKNNNMQDSGTQKDQITKKNIYRYFQRYGVTFDDESQKKQRLRRRDLVTIDSPGYLDQGTKWKRYNDALRYSKRIQRINLAVSAQSANVRFGELKNGVKKQSSLKSISLSLDVAMDDEAIKKLTYGIKRSTNLRSFDLNIGYKQQQITDAGVGILAQCLKRLSSLKSLALRLHSINQMTDKGIKKLGVGLRKMTTLQNLDVKAYLRSLTEKSLQAFAQDFKQMPSLQNIRLAFKWLQLRGLENLRETFEEMSRLQKIIIDFSCESYDERDDRERLCQGLKGLASLKNLYIQNFAFCELPNEDLGMVSETVQELTLLKGLSIDFVMFNFNTTENVQAFHQALKQLSSLEALHFNFQRCYFHGKDAEVAVSLSEALKELKSLKTLKLELDFKVSDKEVHVLNQALKELQSLENLELTIFDRSAFSSQGLQELRENLHQMKSLRSTSLSFYDCEVIDGNELQGLLGGLQDLASFRDITLVFSKCPKISNIELRILSESLKKITSLRNIHLEFQRCKKVDEDGILELCDSFRGRCFCQVDYNSDGIVKRFY